jgi:hypothetical protein
MLNIYDLFECFTENEIDRFIEDRKTIPTEQLTYSYNLNTVVEDSPSRGSFYLAEHDRCVWWFGPRNYNGIAGPNNFKWFCFRTEDGKYHKFNMTDIYHSREAMNKILEWIAKGSALDGPELNLAQDEVEFMDI